MFLKRIYILLLLLCGTSAFAQITKIRGSVKDAETKEPIPYANIIFKGENVGTISDFDGNFFIETNNATDSIIISFLGYKTQTHAVTKNKYQEIHALLESTALAIEEIAVHAGENPAYPFMRKVIKNKKQNSPEKLESYKCKIYNKLEFDISNIDSTMKNKRALKPFTFIFDYIDTSAINGKSYLPIFLSETYSEYYYRKMPKAEKEIIKANKITGIENESVSQFTGDMYTKTNIYDNYINVFGKSFISPLANFSAIYYKYFLIDSSFIDNRWCYQLSFRPRTRQEPTFSGHFWIHDTTFAVVQFEIRINAHANINFINDMVVEHKYAFIDDSVWMLKKETVFADLNISDKSFGVFGRKSTNYSHYKFIDNYDKGFFSGSEGNIQIHDQALDRPKEYWDSLRAESLTLKEQETYQMMDSIKNIPAFRTYLDLIQMFFTGYKVFKWFEFGPYYTMYSFNEIEGNRFRLGGRTSNNVSKKFMITAYTAFGTRDKKIKYGIEGLYVFSKLPRRSISIGYKNDLEQLGQSDNALMADNILTSVFRRTPNDKLTGIDQVKINYEYEWKPGLSNNITFKHKTLYPSQYVPFPINHYGEIHNLSQINTFETTFHTHFAHNEKFVFGEFERVSLGTKFPIFDLYATYGLKDPLGKAYPYTKLRATVEHMLYLNPIGRLEYVIDCGKIFGTLPYPLLELHKGNETYGYDIYAFNLMNYYEFISDTYASLAVTHHFDGFFLNKVPLFRRLKLREVASGKAVIGTISDSNLIYSNLPFGMTTLHKPYVEGGIGIENILKIFRIDALWRMTHLQNDNIAKYGIRAIIQIEF